MSPAHTGADVHARVDKAIPIFKNETNTAGKKRELMMWEDIVLSGDIPAKQVPTDVIIQTWNSVANIKTLTSKVSRLVVLLTM